eukprot:358544-Chlamydomonas_euryale.AAC.4
MSGSLQKANRSTSQGKQHCEKGSGVRYLALHNFATLHRVMHAGVRVGVAGSMPVCPALMRCRPQTLMHYWPRALMHYWPQALHLIYHVPRFERIIPLARVFPKRLVRTYVQGSHGWAGRGKEERPAGTLCVQVRWQPLPPSGY